MLAHRFFQRTPPKSLDRDAFPDLADRVMGMSDADAAATLVRIAAEAVAAGITWCPSVPAQLLVTGGGRHNKAMMAALSELLPCEVVPVEAVGLDGDMLEAQAFAYLERAMIPSAIFRPSVRMPTGSSPLRLIRPDGSGLQPPQRIANCPCITARALPPTVTRDRPGPGASAVARIRLGRPMATP